MEFRVLKYFITIANEQNISRAAQIIHITQPTLSRQIIELEEELGVKLFERNRQNRKFILTDEGVRFYNYAVQITELSQKTVEEFKSNSSQISGKIYIGAGETESLTAIAQAFKKIRESHPKIEIGLFSGDASIICERLDRGLCDFAVFIGFKNVEKYNHLTLPQKDRWGLLTRKDNPLAKYKSIKKENLLEHYEPLFVSAQSARHRELLHWFGGSMEKYNITGTYNLIYNAAIFAKENIASCLTLEGLNDISSESSLCFVPLEPSIYSEVYLAWKKDRELSKAAKHFLETLESDFSNS
ncbi:MAG: LysR family transcriptional regulator [Treponema sp.]|nr:LysR family transcriptional regulator [Treponema sp.]